MLSVQPRQLLILPAALLLVCSECVWAADEQLPSASSPAVKPVIDQPKADDKAVHTVTVSSKIKPTQVDLDRKVYNVAADLQSSTGTAADILNSIPSVQVDGDGNVALRGDNKITILIDGKPSAQLSGPNAGQGLLQYSASDIEKVEVMTNAPAEYMSDGTGGVINIITKRNRQPGSSGALALNVGNVRRYVADLSGALNTSQLNLSGGLGLRQDDRQRNITTNFATLVDGVNIGNSAETLNENARRLIPSLKGALNYRVDEDQSVGFDFKLRQRSGYRFYNSQDISSLSDGSITGETLGHSDGHECSLSGEQRLNVKNNLSSSDEVLELTLHRSTDKERERYLLTTIATIPAGQLGGNQLYQNHHFITGDFSADYRNAISEQQTIKLGISVKRDHDQFDNTGSDINPANGQLEASSTLNSQFRYQRTITAAYSSYQQTVGVVQILAGLRAELTQSQGDQITSNQINQHNYSGFYPNVHIERQLDKQTTLSLAYSKRLARPDPDDLDPYIDYRDPHNLQSGNPNLLPQQSQTLEAGYRVEQEARSVGVNAYVKQINNGFSVLTSLVAPNVLLTQKTNIPLLRSGGLELMSDGALLSALSYRFSSNLYYTQVNTESASSSLSSTTGINLKASLDCRPSAIDTAQISLNRTDKQLTPQGTIAAINLVNMGYKRQLNSNLALVVTVSDVFNGQRSIRTVNTPTLQETYNRFQYGRIAYIGFNYAFGASKKSKSDGFEYDQ